MGKLSLEKISVSEYKKKVSASEIDLRTIYWLDDGTIYVGNNLYGGKVEIIESDPTFPEMNTIYVDKNTLQLKTFNGVSYDVISKGYTISLENTSSDDLVPTAKAVASYVQNKIQEVIESDSGITSISYLENGELSVTKDGETSTIPLNGMTYSPTYDEITRKLTIPIVGSSALEINFAKDTAVTAGKYNEDTNEIWLTLAEDKTYTDESKLIKIPAQGLIDIYTGKETNTTTTTVSETNEISVENFIDDFLRKHFMLYSKYCVPVLKSEPSEKDSSDHDEIQKLLKNEDVNVTKYSSMQEDKQADDITLIAIRRL